MNLGIIVITNQQISLFTYYFENSVRLKKIARRFIFNNKHERIGKFSKNHLINWFVPYDSYYHEYNSSIVNIVDIKNDPQLSKNSSPLKLYN